eukprot:gene12805-15134_t
MIRRQVLSQGYDRDGQFGSCAIIFSASRKIKSDKPAYSCMHLLESDGNDLNAFRYLFRNARREQVNFAYAIIKNKYFDDVVSPLAAEAIQRGDDSKLVGLGLRPDVVLKRYADIQESAALAKKHPELKYSNTITSWSFPPFNSWTRFLFDGPNTTASNSWAGCRPGSLWVNCSKVLPALWTAPK